MVYLNCDDPEWSNFFRFFAINFEYFELRKLITTHYRDDAPSYKLELTRALTPKTDGTFEEDIESFKTPLTQNGDFRSPECVELLEEADVVVTNPPFSLFREYIAQLIEYNKKFLVLGNPNALTYKEIFPLIKENKMRTGYKSMGTDMYFDIPVEFKSELLRERKEGSAYKIIDGVVYGRAQAIWLTNLNTTKRLEEQILYRKYKPEDYPKYDNYDAINVNKVSDIPEDYYGYMGVPITFIDKYNPNQFEIIDCIEPQLKLEDYKRINNGKHYKSRIVNKGTYLNHKTYYRIIIKRKVNGNANN